MTFPISTGPGSPGVGATDSRYSLWARAVDSRQAPESTGGIAAAARRNSAEPAQTASAGWYTRPSSPGSGCTCTIFCRGHGGTTSR